METTSRRNASKMFSSANITDLPNELMCELCTYMPAADIVNLLSTCKIMHTFMRGEPIWRRLCARHNVFDPEQLNGDSFFHIYSGLLHTYGPLIGLWASDHPFFGSVIEFRIDSARRAIVGEAWEMVFGPQDTRPMLPDYELFMAISLPHHIDPLPSQRVQVPAAQFHWHTRTPFPGTFMDTVPVRDQLRVQTDSNHFPSLQVVSPTAATIYLRYDAGGSRFCAHPEFPAPGASSTWLASRTLPRIPIEPPSVHFESAEHAMQWLSRHNRYESLFTAYGPFLKPSALCIKHAVSPLKDSAFVYPGHEQQLEIPDGRWLHPGTSSQDVQSSADRRYYPLRTGYQVGQYPADELWHPSSLEGLWLGDYLENGPELIWLAYSEATMVVSSWKITGDHDVPRGAVSWTIDCSRQLALKDMDVNIRRATEGYMMPRLFRGEGTTSSLGFIEGNQQQHPSVAMILGPDDIAIEWTGLMRGYIFRYRRCPKRDPTREVQNTEFRRHAKDED